MEGINEGILEFYPSFSPDGTKLAYVSSENRDFAITKLKIFDFQTGKKTVLKGYIDSRISWSPDGEEIIYQHADDPLSEEEIATLPRHTTFQQ